MTAGAYLSGRRGQALALTATVLLCLLVWAALVQPLLAWYGERAETLREQRALADRMESLAATLPTLRRDVQSGAAGRAEAGAAMGQSTDAVASATLQERVQSMASAAGATLTSVETLPAEGAGAWRRIGLRVTLTTSWPVLIHLLRSLDQAKPSTLVDDLHVHGVALEAHPVVLPLLTSFTVYAFHAGLPAGTAGP